MASGFPGSNPSSAGPSSPDICNMGKGFLSHGAEKRVKGRPQARMTELKLRRKPQPGPTVLLQEPEGIQVPLKAQFSHHLRANQAGEPLGCDCHAL